MTAFDLVKFVSDWADAFEYNVALALLSSREKALKDKKAECEALLEQAGSFVEIVGDEAVANPGCEHMVEAMHTRIWDLECECEDEEHAIYFRMMEFVSAGRA
jgi:hypothetical protein